MPFERISNVTAKDFIAEGTFRLVLEAPDIGEKAVPGQFVMMGFPTPSADPFLRRPFSIANAEWGRLEFLIRVVGWGTAIIAGLSSNDKIPIFGPLGNGFPEPKQKAVLVAGGIGLPPLLFAARRWRDVKLLYGEKSIDAICKLPEDTGCVPEIATDDGSSGEKGFVTELLKKELKGNFKCDVYACGPFPMLRETAKICSEFNTMCFVSLESRMACGLGACQGCAIRTKKGFKKVCSDGPVFDATEIDWEVFRD